MPISGYGGFSNSFYDTHNKQVFAAMTKKVEKKVDQIAFDRAENMKNFLIFRRYLEGESGARFPKSSPRDKTGKRSGEGHAFQAWRINRVGNAHYQLVNDHVNSQDGFAYPNVLVYGTGNPNSVWWKSYLAGTSTRISKPFNGHLFSKSMPKGLVPYFNRQEALLIRKYQDIDFN